LRIESSSEVGRRFRHQDLQRRPHQTFDEMTSMGGCVGLADHDMCVHFGFSAFKRDIADE